MLPMKKIIYLLAITALGTLAGCIKVSDEALACKKPATPATAQAVYDANYGDSFTLEFTNYNSSFNYTLLLPDGNKLSSAVLYPFRFTLSTTRAGVYKVVANTDEQTPCVSDTGYFTVNLVNNTSTCPLPANKFLGAAGPFTVTLTNGDGFDFGGYYRMRWTMPNGDFFSIRTAIAAPSTTSVRTYTVKNKSGSSLLAGECNATYIYSTNSSTEYYATNGTVTIQYNNSLGLYQAQFCDVFIGGANGTYKGTIYCNP